MCRLCGGQSHRLFDEYMLAQGQRSTSMVVVEVWAAAYDYGLEALNCKQFRNRRTSHGHPEIVSNFSRPAEIALLDCNQFRCRVCQECRDMSVSSPPSRSDYAAFDSFWHETTSTIETMHGCGDNCRRLAMPIVTNVVLSHHSRRPVEIKVVWHATANWSQICFAQSAIAIPSLREDGVYVSRPFVYPALLSFCTNHLTNCFSRAVGAR